ncbi:hypothetical protein L2E82_39817 [Cichorium intybus]|uniref:Uncharacterized protein n=1 Tax=Cichorium intybus TaxID=13427 RepID=A0ACB9AJ21_CICIN|nr:hypothetical protein L2E82_39817 [Cichorium intybus]
MSARESDHFVVMPKRSYIVLVHVSLSETETPVTLEDNGVDWKTVILSTAGLATAASAPIPLFGLWRVALIVWRVALMEKAMPPGCKGACLSSSLQYVTLGYIIK